ncbi:hypothetical protein [Rheinheimera sp. MMS21-TC3]|nr:hypothetical protein [Rheinheimera sp. MMS21-TC3]WNO60207.1 hypothetical protein RDV63_04390 [Rheinheimera sp. MMS21-TC3]
MTIVITTVLQTKSELTVVDGKVKFANKASYPELYTPIEPALPNWSPVNQ